MYVFSVECFAELLRVMVVQTDFLTDLLVSSLVQEPIITIVVSVCG